MKTIVASTLAVCMTLIAASGAQSRNLQKNDGTAQQHHSGDGSALLLGNYNTLCFFMFPGAAGAETRNLTAGGRRQQVVHLRAQGGGANAQAYVKNLDLQRTIVAAPISFSLVTGGGRSLIVLVGYTPQGATESVQRGFVTPDTVTKSIGNFKLIDYGKGSYIIPLGDDGIPAGAQLNKFEFLQLGGEFNCDKHVSNIARLQINRSFVGISTDPADSCEHNCDGGSSSAEN